GFNTGIGSLKNVGIEQDKITQFQQNYIKSHSVGVGKPLDIEVIRGAMLLQANALAKGHSGVRSLIIDKLIEMLNKGIHPVVPSQGSLGASGDLAQLTHIASVLVGEPEAEIWVQGDRVKLGHLLEPSGTFTFKVGQREVSFQTIALAGKEAIALTNATSVMLSIALHLIQDVEILLKNADIAAALSLEAMMCEKDAFAQELHELRNQVGQINTAKNINGLVADSKRMSLQARHDFFKHITNIEIHNNLRDQNNGIVKETLCNYKYEHEFEKERVQDAYSLRCIPQVHGACKDAYNFVRSVIEREIVAVTDNPVLFKPEGTHEYIAKSGGNFHGEPLAMAMDFLAIALTEIGSISDRRVFRLLSPRMSFGLTRNLAGGEAGVNSGYMMLQYTGAALVSENKGLAHPASIDSIPTSDNQEDHVSMGLTAARKARRIAANTQYLMAIEYLCAMQGIHLSARHDPVSLTQFQLGRGTRVAFEHIGQFADSDGRPLFGMMQQDEYLQTKIERMREIVDTGSIVKAIEESMTLLV
ncbi:MAG: histidine ammonia-lyase, partial [bacterium]